MRLLIVTQVMDVEHPILGFFVRWVEEFAKHCEQVIVICLQEGKHALPHNVRVLSLGKESGVSRLKYLTHFYQYIWRERHNYDSVFVHMNQIYVILGGLFWRAWGKKVGLWYLHKHVSLSLRLAVHGVHAIFSASPESFRIRTKKAHFVGHGIDIDMFPLSLHPLGAILRAVTIGRISPVKNIELLIDAVARMHARDMACTLTVVGDAPEEQRAYKHRLIEQARGRDIESSMTWEGSRPHDIIPSILSAHDVFLHASSTGSLDKTVLEALACGTFPVTCDPTLSRELPDDLKPVCITNQNDVESYVRAMLSLRSLSQDESTRLRHMGREYVEHHHSLSRLIPKIFTIFVDAVKLKKMHE